MENDRTNVTLLLDYYGGILTVKQRNYLELYYNEDLSLSEIAELEGISRPGVHDVISRTRHKLADMERRLGLVERYMKTREGIDRALALAVETSADEKLIATLTEVSNGI